MGAFCSAAGAFWDAGPFAFREAFVVNPPQEETARSVGVIGPHPAARVGFGADGGAFGAVRRIVLIGGLRLLG